MTRRRIVGWICLGALLAAGIALARGGGSAVWAGQTATVAPAAATPVATPTPGFATSLLAQADVSGLPAEATLSVVTVTLPGGTEARPFANPGPVIVLVQRGAIALDADVAQVSVPRPRIGPIQAATPEPAAATDLAVTNGQQVLLPAGATATIRNPGAETATLLVIAVVAREPDAPASPDASA